MTVSKADIESCDLNAPRDGTFFGKTVPRSGFYDREGTVGKPPRRLRDL